MMMISNIMIILIILTITIRMIIMIIMIMILSLAFTVTSVRPRLIDNIFWEFGVAALFVNHCLFQTKHV